MSNNVEDRVPRVKDKSVPRVKDKSVPRGSNCGPREASVSRESTGNNRVTMAVVRHMDTGTENRCPKPSEYFLPCVTDTAEADGLGDYMLGEGSMPIEHSP